MKFGKSKSAFLLFIAGVFITGSSPFDRVEIKIHNRAPASEIIEPDPKNPVDALWLEIKANFESSELCGPDKVLHDPAERLNPILIYLVADELVFLVKSDSWVTKEWRLKRMRSFAEEYQLSESVVEYAVGLIQAQEETPSARYQTLERVRGEILKDMNQLSKLIPGYMASHIREELFEQKIFDLSEEDEIRCPFVELLPFRRAMAGRSKILTAHKSSISRPDLLTIVDFTQPSHERRLFVIDVPSKTVKHNTFVAHGGGLGNGSREREEAGKDSFGGTPTTSNEKWLSFEGFYIATGTYSAWDNTYGPNISFKGIDLQGPTGDKVLHGWRTPFNGFLSGPWDWFPPGSEKGKRIRPKDIWTPFLKLDPRTADIKEISDAFSAVMSEVRPSPFKRMETTNGCPGVPDQMVPVLQKELKGSLMFNYNDGMKSKWF